MKKVFVGIGVILVALVAAVLIVPSLVDWNDYKPEITALAKKVTGRNLYIDGDIRAAILPAPALVAHKVRFANIKGADAAEMVRLKSVEVRIALRSLLKGQVQFETIKLVDPVIALEILADGRKNWNLQTKETGGGGPSTTSPSSTGRRSASQAIALSLDNFIIQNGTLIFHDHKNLQIERIKEINARIAAASLSGPFEASGSFNARGIPLKLNATLGKIIEGRTASLSANLELVAGAAKVQAVGALVNLAEAPTLKAKVISEGGSLAKVLHTLEASDVLPGFLAQPFKVEGDVVASAVKSSVTGLKLRFGETQVTGSVKVSPDTKTGIPNIVTKLAVNRVDLDKWLAMPAAIPQMEKKPRQKSSTKAKNKSSAAAPKKTKANKQTGFSIPKGFNVSLNAMFDALIYQKGIIRQAKANVELANGEVTISQMTAQLPGTTDVALFGILSEKRGKPRFEGKLEVAASNVRGVASWLEFDLPKLPSGRLRRLTMAGKFTATPQKIDIAGLDLQFDSSRLTGAATIALRTPIAFGANFVLDRINLDAYLPRGSKTGAAKDKKFTSSPVSKPSKTQKDKTKKDSMSPWERSRFSSHSTQMLRLMCVCLSIKAPKSKTSCSMGLYSTTR